MSTKDALKEIDLLAHDDDNNKTNISSSSSSHVAMKLPKKAKVSSTSSPLLNLPNEILTECLLYLPLKDTFSLSQSCHTLYNCWNDALYFSKVLARDYPSTTTSSNNKTDAKEMYLLHNSITTGYNPRWYKLQNVKSSQNPIGQRQGFGKALLLGCPVVYGGWVVSRHGFVLVDCDVLYLRKQQPKKFSKGDKKGNAGRSGNSRTMFFSEGMGEEGMTTTSSCESSMDGAKKSNPPPPAGYDWATIQTSGTPPRGSYCVAATAYDYVPIPFLKNIDGFEEIALKRNWTLEENEEKNGEKDTMPVLFVSGGLTEGGYRFALSQLYALVGGTVKKEEKTPTKIDANDDDKKEAEEDMIQKYDWHWIKLSGGTYDEISANATTVSEAIASVVDSVDPPSSPSYHHRNDDNDDTTTTTQSRTCSDTVSTYGGSARACHSLWYDSTFHTICMFGGFTDMVARKSHVLHGVFNNTTSNKITQRIQKEQEEENVMGHLHRRMIHQSLHQLEIFDLQKGKWGKVVQSGDYPIGRFGCSVLDITSTSKKNKEGDSSTYLVMGGCTGRHNHKGPMENGEELVNVSTHRVLTLQRVNDIVASSEQVEMTAKWRTLNATEQVHLGMDKCYESTTLGRLHASCALSERSYLFFGGGPSYRCSSSLVLMNKCQNGVHSVAKATGEGKEEGSSSIPWKWKNKGVPLTPYHYWDGNDRNTAETTLIPSHSKSDDSTSDTTTNTPYVPPLELARMDCLLQPDPNRPGEAFMFGGWREEELGDTWKLVVGVQREDEVALYGERVGETVWNERQVDSNGGGDESDDLSAARAQRLGRVTPGLFHRFWG